MKLEISVRIFVLKDQPIPLYFFFKKKILSMLVSNPKSCPPKKKQPLYSEEDGNIYKGN